MAWLKIYKIEKEIFLLNFEQGHEVLIPKELAQDSLPISFRYYDPIIMLIQDKLSRERREYYKIKKQLGLIFEEKLSLKNQLQEYLYGEDPGTKKTKIVDMQTFQELEPGEINYFESKHAYMVQRSKYVQVEDSNQVLKYSEDDDAVTKAVRELEFVRQIDVEFLKTKDVEKTCMRNLMYKSQFLYRLQNLK